MIPFAPLFSPLCFSTRHNTRARHFVPVTLAEWCQLHKDSCGRAQRKREREREREVSVRQGGSLPVLEGISTNERKGSYSSEGEARTGRERERERERNRAAGENRMARVSLQVGTSNEHGEPDENRANPCLIPPWHFFKNRLQEGRRGEKSESSRQRYEAVSLPPFSSTPALRSFMPRVWASQLFPSLCSSRSLNVQLDLQHLPFLGDRLRTALIPNFFSSRWLFYRSYLLFYDSSKLSHKAVL